MSKSGSVETAQPPVDELVELVLRGQSEAFEPTIRRYQDEVTGTVHALLYDRSATEDVVQQVLLNAFARLDTFERGRDFGAWIRMIARNAVRQEMRRQSRYSKRIELYTRIVSRRQSASANPKLHEQLLHEALARCVARLPQVAAQTVRLRYVQGCPIEQIAETIGRSNNAVRQLLARVRVKLRQCVDQEMAQV